MIAGLLTAAGWLPVFPALLAALDFAPGSLGGFVAAFLGGFAGNVVTSIRAIEAHARSCPARRAHDSGRKE